MSKIETVEAAQKRLSQPVIDKIFHFAGEDYRVVFFKKNPMQKNDCLRPGCFAVSTLEAHYKHAQLRCCAHPNCICWVARFAYTAFF